MSQSGWWNYVASFFLAPTSPLKVWYGMSFSIKTSKIYLQKKKSLKLFWHSSLKFWNVKLADLQVDRIMPVNFHLNFKQTLDDTNAQSPKHLHKAFPKIYTMLWISLDNSQILHSYLRFLMLNWISFSRKLLNLPGALILAVISSSFLLPSCFNQYQTSPDWKP